MAKEFYGIDLGTTYSCIATIDSDDLVTVIPNKKGALTTPSAVYFDDDNKMQVGKAAKAHLADKPENTVVFIKREMSNPDYKVTINGKSYDPVQISSFILRHLVDFANEKRKNEEGKDPINDVVITVPAYFGKMERDRTEAAGKMAGLNVLQLINEPSAAALSYGRKQQSDKNLLVYDLGGGTFDVSILEFKTGIADVLSTRGDHHLGGVDWDKALAYWKTLKRGDDAVFDKELEFDGAAIEPMVTYGTNPGMGMGISERIPTLDTVPESGRVSYTKSLGYMGFEPGEQLLGKKVDYVFLGACTNGRIEDFRAFASIVKGRKKVEGLVAWLVPGSWMVDEQIRQEGLDKVLEEAGFAIRQPGCSACLAMNDDKIPAGKLSVSTSNRNFEGRQGPGARTILASPLVAAAAAVTGVITDPRELM